MVRRNLSRLAVASFAAICAAQSGAALPAGAQSLQRLTVESFALTTDTLRPGVDVPFHIVVLLRVLQRVAEIDNLELPMLAQLELLGDERQISSGPGGTQYREVITVVAHASGTIPLAPATLQAVDARDGKAKQWFTNGLVLHAGLAPGQILRNGGSALLSGAIILLRVLLIFVALGCLVLLGIVLVRRANRAVPPPVEAVAPPPPPPPRTIGQQLADALTVLRAERTRSAAVRVRVAVWRAFGATPGETLADVLRRPGTQEPAIRDVLVALERSAFTYDDDLPGAIADACDALERYEDSLP
jgi:hypothetical protein